jgi:hypothetical protein
MAQGDEVGQLWEQLRQKDAQILMLQKKLQHFRTWLGSVNTRVQQMNPSAVRNARKLYIGGGCSQQLSAMPLLMVMLTAAPAAMQGAGCHSKLQQGQQQQLAPCGDAQQQGQVINSHQPRCAPYSHTHAISRWPKSNAPSH